MQFTTRINAIAVALVIGLCSLVCAGGALATAGNPGSGEPVAPPAHSHTPPDPAESASRAAVDSQAATALADQEELTVAEARERLAQERSLDGLGDQLTASLQGRTGGAYLDSNGDLVVTTLDRASSAALERSGARAKLVDDSAARLDGIVSQLDRKASENGAAGVQGWYVDVPNNTVVVTVTEGATDASTTAITKLARGFGQSVRIERRPASEAPRDTAEYLVGGNQYVLPSGGTCSVGFNTVDAWNRNVVLTAGHCTKQGGWMSRSGYYIGQVRTANYPGDDFGTFWNSYPTYWLPTPSINRYNGTYSRVVGRWDNPPVGTTVCKSGRTTYFTCGRITAVNASANYGNGNLLYGLVRHNACVEGGDSGGSNISGSSYALGVTSGASMISGKCLSKFGYSNVSYYQPVGEALNANRLRLVL